MCVRNGGHSSHKAIPLTMRRFSQFAADAISSAVFGVTPAADFSAVTPAADVGERDCVRRLRAGERDNEGRRPRERRRRSSFSLSLPLSSEPANLFESLVCLCLRPLDADRDRDRVGLRVEGPRVGVALESSLTLLRNSSTRLLTSSSRKVCALLPVLFGVLVAEEVPVFFVSSAPVVRSFLLVSLQRFDSGDGERESSLNELRRDLLP